MQTVTPDAFRKWYASLSPACQDHARRLYDAATNNGAEAVMSSSLAIIVSLVNDMAAYEKSGLAELAMRVNDE